MNLQIPTNLFPSSYSGMGSAWQDFSQNQALPAVQNMLTQYPDFIRNGGASRWITPPVVTETGPPLPKPAPLFPRATVTEPAEPIPAPALRPLVPPPPPIDWASMPAERGKLPQRIVVLDTQRLGYVPGMRRGLRSDRSREAARRDDSQDEHRWQRNNW